VFVGVAVELEEDVVLTEADPEVVVGNVLVIVEGIVVEVVVEVDDFGRVRIMPPAAIMIMITIITTPMVRAIEAVFFFW
jgi:hypothetical protein